MNLQQLKTLIYVAQEESFTRAAEILSVTQPAVTAQVQALENELHEKLFDRLGKRVHLTDAGRILLPYAKRITQLVDEAERAVTDIHALNRGSFTLGGTGALSLELMPQAVWRFHNEHPNIVVVLKNAIAEGIVQGVLDNTLDIGVAYGLSAAGELHVEELFRDSFVFVAAPDYLPLRDQTVPLNVREVARLPLITLTKDTVVRPLIEARLKESGIEPNIIMELESSAAIVRMVEMGIGVGIVSHVTIGHELRSGTLSVLDVEGWNMVHPVSLFYRHDKHLSQAMLEFLAVLREVGAGFDVDTERVSPERSFQLAGQKTTTHKEEEGD